MTVRGIALATGQSIPSPTFTGTVTFPDGSTWTSTGLTDVTAASFTANKIALSGNIAGAFATTGVALTQAASTITDSTTGAGTLATSAFNYHAAPTYATAANAITITNAFGTYFTDPVAGSHVTMTAKWALGSDSLAVGTSSAFTVTTAGAISAAASITAQGQILATGNVVARGNTAFLAYQNSTPVNVFEVTSVNNFTGAGAATDAAVVGPSGQIIFYTNNSTTAAVTLATDNSATFSNVVKFSTASKGVVLKTGANGCVGTFVCNGTTPVTVNNTNIAISDAIIISLNTVGGTVGAVPAVKTITASSGFTVAGTASDTSTYNYAIIKNA